MSPEHEPVDPHLRLLRIIAAAVLVGLIALYILGGLIVRLPFLRADLQLDPLTLGSLFGALFVLLGLIAAPRWPRDPPR
jgi:uncharacterized membrane protein